MRENDVSNTCPIINIPEYVRRVMDRLKSAGYSTYLVGGCVRDALLGKEPHDYDLATSATPEKSLVILGDMHCIETGLSHGTITVISDGRPLELTTFRVDGSYSDCRRPDSVRFTSSIVEDLARRDITINAMAYDADGNFVDEFGGRADLSAGIVRAVGDSRVRFCEDALRIMRVFRFAAQLGFTVDEATLKGAVECRERLALIAKERISAELLRLLASPYPRQSLHLICKLGIMPYVIGDYPICEDIIDSIEKLPAEGTIRLGFLLSKLPQEQRRDILSRLKVSNRQRAEALAVADGASYALTDRTQVGRFCAKYQENAQIAVTASITAGNSPAKALDWVRECRLPVSVLELALSGGELMEAGFEGKEIRRQQQRLFEMVISGEIKNEREELLRAATSQLD